MERGESAGQSYFGGNWVALPDERAHDNALRLARMHPVIAFEGVAEGHIAEMCLFSAWWDFGSDHRFLEQHIQAEQEQLVRIEARLRSLEQGSGLPTYEVVLKAARPITGVSLHLKTTDLAYQAHWIDAIDAMLKHYGVKPIDHLLVLHAESEDEHTPGSMEIVAPVDCRDAHTLITRSEGRLTRCSLPAFPRMASTLHHGHPALVLSAYQALGTWMENGSGAKLVVTSSALMRK